MSFIIHGTGCKAPTGNPKPYRNPQMARHDPQVVKTDGQARPTGCQNRAAGSYWQCENMQPSDQNLPDRDTEQLCGGVANVCYLGPCLHGVASLCETMAVSRAWKGKIQSVKANRHQCTRIRSVSIFRTSLTGVWII